LNWKVYVFMIRPVDVLPIGAVRSAHGAKFELL
jgi:hypothetical protein